MDGDQRGVRRNALSLIIGHPGQIGAGALNGAGVGQGDIAFEPEKTTETGGIGDVFKRIAVCRGQGHPAGRQQGQGLGRRRREDERRRLITFPALRRHLPALINLGDGGHPLVGLQGDPLGSQLGSQVVGQCIHAAAHGIARIAIVRRRRNQTAVTPAGGPGVDQPGHLPLVHKALKGRLAYGEKLGAAIGQTRANRTCGQATPDGAPFVQQSDLLATALILLRCQ